MLSISQLDEADRALYEEAQAAAQMAYAPYSHLRVGAAIRTEHGTYHACNVENASLGLTMCAERSSVFAAIAAEGPDVTILAVAVYAEAHQASPCGACRQVLAEFAPAAKLIFRVSDGISVTNVSRSLPFRFDL